MIGLNCLTPIVDVSFGSKADLGVLFGLDAEDSDLDFEVPGLVFGDSGSALDTSGSALALGASGSALALETSGIALGASGSALAPDSNMLKGAAGMFFASGASITGFVLKDSGCGSSLSTGLKGLGAAARNANASSMSMLLKSGFEAAEAVSIGASVFSEDCSLPEKRSSLMLGFFAPEEDLRAGFFLASRPLANSIPNPVRDTPSPADLRSTMRPRDTRRLMEESLPVAEASPAIDCRTS